MLGTRNIEHYFLLQNVGWVENLRHSNCAHIFSVRKLLCKTQRHVYVCFFSKPRILLPMISLERQRVVESVCHCDFSFLRLKLKRLQLGLNFTLWKAVFIWEQWLLSCQFEMTNIPFSICLKSLRICENGVVGRTEWTFQELDKFGFTLELLCAKINNPISLIMIN